MPGVLGPADVIHLDGFGRGESQPPVVASACCGAGGGVGIGGFKLGVGRIVGNDTRIAKRCAGSPRKYVYLKI